MGSILDQKRNGRKINGARGGNKAEALMKNAGPEGRRYEPVHRVLLTLDGCERAKDVRRARQCRALHLMIRAYENFN
jgi:hypothetical protein